MVVLFVLCWFYVCDLVYVLGVLFLWFEVRFFVENLFWIIVGLVVVCFAFVCVVFMRL